MDFIFKPELRPFDAEHDSLYNVLSDGWEFQELSGEKNTSTEAFVSILPNLKAMLWTRALGSCWCYRRTETELTN